MDRLDRLKQLRSFVIPPESSVYPHYVFDDNLVLLVLWLDIIQYRFALVMPIQLHQAVGLNRVQKRTLIILLQTYKYMKKKKGNSVKAILEMVCGMLDNYFGTLTILAVVESFGEVVVCKHAMQFVVHEGSIISSCLFA